jgi:hypothetical protein
MQQGPCVHTAQAARNQRYLATTSEYGPSCEISSDYLDAMYAAHLSLLGTSTVSIKCAVFPVCVLARIPSKTADATVSCQYPCSTLQDLNKLFLTLFKLTTGFRVADRISHLLHSHSTRWSPLLIRHRPLYIMVGTMVANYTLDLALRSLQLVFAIVVMGTDGYGMKNQHNQRLQCTAKSNPVV